jgi:hypothetical protein
MSFRITLHYVIPNYPTPCHSEERSDEESLDTQPERRQPGPTREERLPPLIRQSGPVRQVFRDFSPSARNDMEV